MLLLLLQHGTKVSKGLLKVSNECQEQMVFYCKMRLELFGGLASK
jgi:hypothetical protein